MAFSSDNEDYDVRSVYVYSWAPFQHLNFLLNGLLYEGYGKCLWWFLGEAYSYIQLWKSFAWSDDDVMTSLDLF